MDEPNRNSMKIDIESVRLSSESEKIPKETYKPIFDSDHQEGGAEEKLLNSNPDSKKIIINMVLENGDRNTDGADERMLAQKDEVKFISGDRQNGDAKIDIGTFDKAFTGMTKEELMKFANDPFWVRLRWFFFILFWLLWIAMLVGAVLIIIQAPKCSPPTKLTWYKQGPLVQVPMDSVDESIVADVKQIGAKGVIFALPSNETYLVHNQSVMDKLKKLIGLFKDTNINLILDLTPNFISNNDELFRKALIDPTYRSAFVWSTIRSTQPTNWLAKTYDGSAWQKYNEQDFVLSQFGQNFTDLQLNDPLANKKFKDVLKELIEIGFKGFRLANAKHFIINVNPLKDEEPAAGSFGVHNEYNFWTHTQTTFQNGLAELLYDFGKYVRNLTNDEGFVSVTENIERPEAFKLKSGVFGIELPVYGLLTHTLAAKKDQQQLAKTLHTELKQIIDNINNDVANGWIQWQYDLRTLATSTTEIGISEYNMFLMLLPGVAVSPIDGFKISNSTELINELEELRMSPSYMHGSFSYYSINNVIAYSRIKSGNPGYFILFNPTNAAIDVNIANITHIPDQMTVRLMSNNYKVPNIVEKGKIPSTAIPISENSVIILTFVPKSSG